MDLITLEKNTLADLRRQAKELGVERAARLKKEDLLVHIRRAEAAKQGREVRGGILEIMNEGVGFLRSDHYQGGPDDVYVSQTQVRRYSLRNGDLIIGEARPPRESEKHFGLAMRMINLVAPVGRGQRGLIVSPPKSGKTTILKEMANSISTNYKDVHLMVALIGERPEEVTDMDRSVDAEVISSTFDEPVTSHVRPAEMVIERAKRLVEIGRDVVVLLDSLTRLAGAYNLVGTPSGRT